MPTRVGVLGEPVGGLPVEPAAGVLERLGEVPVEERGHRPDARLEQGVDEPVVERETGCVRPARPSG
jgi:hypothetical protein